MSEVNVRIQDDLYEAVNGEWLKTAVIPEDRPTTGGFSDLDQDVEKIMMADFKALAAGEKHSDIPEMRYAVALYKKVLDTERRNREGIAPALPLLERIRGIRTAEDIRLMLKSGADKVSLNTAAVLNPDLIRAGSDRFGAQCIVLAIDARRVPGENRWEVYTHGGRRPTGIDALEWAVRGVELGAGEILLTSMDTDGTKAGYDCELTAAVADSVPVPVIASGGAGDLDDLAEVIEKGRADAVLAASIFHFGTYTVGDAKRFLAGRGIPVRI